MFKIYNTISVVVFTGGMFSRLNSMASWGCLTWDDRTNVCICRAINFVVECTSTT